MQNSPLILAIETSVGPCSVSILQGAEVVSEDVTLDFHQQSSVLIPMCESILQKQGLSYLLLEGIAASCGPGSFTSIRVGLAAAKALAFAAQKPFFGVSTLEAMAYTVSNPHGADILVALDAHRGEVYAQTFDANAQPTSEAIVSPVISLTSHFKQQRYLLAGNQQEALLPLFPSSIISSVLTPSAAMVGKLVHAKRNAESDLNRSFHVSPIYIRPPDAKLPAQTFSV